MSRARALFFALAALGCLGWAGCASSGYVRPKARALPAGVHFDGDWSSTWGAMKLTEDGTHVYGTFSGYREGALSGHLEGDLFHFIWNQQAPRSHGRGYLQITPDGQHLEGRWGYGENDIDGGRWAADR